MHIARTGHSIIDTSSRVCFAESVTTKPPSQVRYLFGIPLTYFALWGATFIVVSTFLFFVHLRVEQLRHGYAIHGAQQELMRLDEERELLLTESATLKRPQRLEELARAHLSLVSPTENQIVRLELNPFELEASEVGP